MDWSYIINFFLLLLFSYLNWKHPHQKYFKYAVILEFVFIALRAPVVGADTWNYIRFLDGERNFYNYDDRELEIGFQVYKHILVSLHGPRVLYMIINTLLTCYPVYYLIKKYSFNKPMSLALMTILNIYFSYFCALRQLLGFAILLVGLIYVVENRRHKWFIFALTSLLGYTFHTTIVFYVAIFLICYFAVIKDRLVPIAIITVTAIAGIILQSFDIIQTFNLFLALNISATERIDTYFMNNDINSIDSIFLSLRPSILAIIAFCFIDTNKLNHWFSKIYLLGIALSNLFVTMPMINRVNVGMNVFGLIVITWCFGSRYKNDIRIRKIENIVFCVLILYYLQMTFKNNDLSNYDFRDNSRMHPYQLFFEDYSSHPSIKYF